MIEYQNAAVGCVGSDNVEVFAGVFVKFGRILWGNAAGDS